MNSQSPSGEMAAEFTLSHLAELIGAELRPKSAASNVISGVGTLAQANTQQLAFLANKKYRDQLEAATAGAVLVREDVADSAPVPALVCKDPYLAFARLAQLFAPSNKQAAGIHPSASISESADIHPSASIAANVVVGDNVSIAEGCQVGAGTILADNVSLGADCQLAANVTLYAGTQLGERVRLHSGAVLGADGFGIAWAGSYWEKIPQLGRVVVGNDVEIGANTTIDRGAIEDTVIGNGVKLDNQIQIGHNCRIGDHTAIAAQVAIAGSTQIGAHCLIGGQVGLAGHLNIADGVTVLQDNGVLTDLPESGQYSMGFAAGPAAQTRRLGVRLKKLDTLMRSVKTLESEVRELRAIQAEQPASPQEKS